MRWHDAYTSLHAANSRATHAELAAAAEALGLNPTNLEPITNGFLDEVAAHATALGLDQTPSDRLLADSLARANQVLGGMATSLTREHARNDAHATLLRCIHTFSVDAKGEVLDVIRTIGRSAAELLKARLVGCFFRRREELTGLSIVVENGEERVMPAAALFGIERLSEMGRLLVSVGEVVELQSWIGAQPSIGQVLVMAQDDWTAAWLMDSPAPTDATHAVALLANHWSMALTAAARQERSVRLAEQLVQANRRLVETREQVVHDRAMASLGELARGAAHEFNNPLLIISANAQMLREANSEVSNRTALDAIVAQSHKLSDMVSALHELSQPLRLRPVQVEVEDWIPLAIAEVSPSPQVVCRVDPTASQAFFDPDQLRLAILELLHNAHSEESVSKIVISTHIDPLDGRWMLRLADDGPGLSDKALAHAFDPFFSQKPAGRRTGLGLARARRIVEAHGGELLLKNRSPRGATATIKLPASRTVDRSNAAAA